MSTETTPENSEATPVDSASEQALLDQLRGDLDRFRDLAMRSAADLENYRKRASREKEDAVKYANAAFLERLVPILDNFELGLQAAKGDAAGSAIMAGLEMVARQLQDFLTACGVEPVNADPGVTFDPNVHEAIGQQEHPEIGEGAVIQQLRKGFKLRDRLLRPATVLVSKGKQAGS
jgi:molecular chaperone GrpE